MLRRVVLFMFLASMTACSEPDSSTDPCADCLCPNEQNCVPVPCADCPCPNEQDCVPVPCTPDEESETFAMSGQVTGDVAAGVRVEIGGASGTVLVDTVAGGDFTVDGLVPGEYLVTPSLQGFVMAPASRRVEILDSNVVGVDFASTAVSVTPETYSVSGAVHGAISAGVAINLGGDASAGVTTGATGTYTFTTLESGSYTISPDMPGYSFVPASIQVTLSDADSQGHDFVASAIEVEPGSSFVYVEDGVFKVDGEVLRFAGTNAYYLANYEKLDAAVVNRALDAFAAAGIEVVRMWAFFDGTDCSYYENDNVIQTAPGVYDESALQDLDNVIAKGKERGIRFILALTNYWDEHGGICQYNTWAGAANPSKDMAFFMTNAQTRQWFREYIAMLLDRTNTVTGVRYKNEPAIFAWEIMNEGNNPAAGSDATPLRDWYQEMAQYIKSIDTNHMVATGEEGFEQGTPSQYSVSEYSNTYVLRTGTGTSYLLNTAIPEIDFGSAHWYPSAWGFSGLENRLRAQSAWMRDHNDIAAALGKPFVLGEYGYPGWGDETQSTLYNALWLEAEEIELDGSLLWQLAADWVKCWEYGGNICYPGGRADTALYQDFVAHIAAIQP